MPSAGACCEGPSLLALPRMRDGYTVRGRDTRRRMRLAIAATHRIEFARAHLGTHDAVATAIGRAALGVRGEIAEMIGGTRSGAARAADRTVHRFGCTGTRRGRSIRAIARA